MIPTTEPIVSSPENLSTVVTPFILMNLPFLSSSSTSESCSGWRKSFTEIVSVKSVTSKIRIILPFLNSFLTVKIICPLNVISPISWITVSRVTGSSLKSLPYITSGLSECLTGRMYSFLNSFFSCLVSASFSFFSAGVSAGTASVFSVFATPLAAISSIIRWTLYSASLLCLLSSRSSYTTL